MQDHGLRRSSVSEMHLRRWPVLPVPCHIVQWVLDVDASERELELELIERAAVQQDKVENPSHREGRINDKVRFAWERHSEGSSLTLFAKDCDEQGFLDPASDRQIQAAIDWARTLPGQIVRATRVWLAASDAEIEALLPRLDLNSDELVSSRIDGAIRIWSDFRINADGFGRLLVAANGADPRDLTRQLQRMQELGNYRNKALLGLPVAQECWPKLAAAEERLRVLADRVANSAERDDALLGELSALALDVASISSAISYRMDATRAYANIVEERLDQLNADTIPGFASLTDFTQRRFRPAMATCVATTDRIERLGVRAEHLCSLLRTRIETRIENQNAEQLHSMEQSISMQVRLQQLVEGLSVAALSYYALGLIGYVLLGLPKGVLGVDKNTLLAILVVPVVGLVWLVTRSLKRRLLDDDRG